jgi:hypothetical protein
LIPTGAGETREIDLAPYAIDGASWFPDGKRLLVSIKSEEGSELAIVDALTSAIQRLPQRGLTFARGTQPVSPDGTIAVLTDPTNDALVLLDLTTGDRALLPATIPGETPLRWSEDGTSIYVARYGAVPVPVHRIELGTGLRTRLSELMPSDPAGVSTIIRAAITPDGSMIAFNYLRLLSTLYVTRYP